MVVPGRHRPREAVKKPIIHASKRSQSMSHVSSGKDDKPHPCCVSPKAADQQGPLKKTQDHRITYYISATLWTPTVSFSDSSSSSSFSSLWFLFQKSQPAQANQTIQECAIPFSCANNPSIILDTGNPWQNIDRKNT